MLQTLGQKRLLEKQQNDKPASKIARLSTNNSAKQIKPFDPSVDAQPKDDCIKTRNPSQTANADQDFQTLKSARQESRQLQSNSDYYRKE